MKFNFNTPNSLNWAMFIIVLLAFAWFYNFHEILFFGPQSAHFWRQTDCLSFTLNYMQEGRGLLNPTIHYIGRAGNGEVVSDFPILFYFIGQIWQITGQQEWIFRFIVFLIFAASLSTVFWVLKHYVKNTFLAIGIPMLLFTSPVIAYYSLNFVMNIVSFSLALIGLSFFYWFYKSGKTRLLWLSAVFYLLGGLIKIPALMSFVIIVFIYLSEVSGIIKYKREKAIFYKKIAHALPLLIVVVLVTAWVAFVSFYNKGNEGLYLVGIYPIWYLNMNEIRVIVDLFFDFWYAQHFHRSLHIATFIMLGWIFFNFKSLKAIEKVFVVLFPFGVIMFLLIWFKAMPEHDYYLTNTYGLFVLVWAISVKLLIDKFNKTLQVRIIQLLFSALLIFNAFHCRDELYSRYNYWWNNQYRSFYEPIKELKPLLKEKGIQRTDTIVSIGDYTPNATLYLLDMKGWSNFGGHMSNTDSASISKSIQSGAKYMVVIDTSQLNEDYLKPYTNNLLIEYKSLKVYDLLEE